MSTLSKTLRKVRGVRGATLRQVEKATGVSNAYLSQLENGSTSKPSPEILMKLAGFYEVPYESLLRSAGYLPAAPPSEAGAGAHVSAIEAALLSVKLTEDEEFKVAEFIEFLRVQRRQRGQ